MQHHINIDRVIGNIERGIKIKSNIDKYIMKLRNAGKLDVLVECGIWLNGTLYTRRTNLLSYYVFDNNYEKIKELLSGENVANRLVVDEEGCSALAFALHRKKIVSSFDVRIIDLLLEKDIEAQINLRENDGNTPIYSCIRNQDLFLLKRFLPFANLNTLLTQARIGDTEEMATPLFIAVNNEESANSVEMIEELLKYYPKEQLLQKSTLDRLPIHNAAKLNRINFAKILLRSFTKDQLEAADKNGNTPLHLAVGYGHAEMSRLILEQGGAGLACIRDFSKYNFLDFSSLPQKEIKFLSIEDIINKINKDKAKATEGAIPLQLAFYNKRQIPDYPYLSIINTLLNYGAPEQLQIATPAGESMLTLAVMIPDQKIAPLIVSEINKHTKNSLLLKADQYGLLPLHYAVLRNYIETTKELLKNEPMEQVNTFFNQFLPIHLACQTGNIRMMDLLLSYEPGQINIKTKGQEFTPLHLVACMVKNKLPTQFLLRKHADRLLKDKDQALPVHMAMTCNNIQVVDELLSQETEAQILAQNNKDNNILHLAELYGRYEEAIFILKKYSSICQKALSIKNNYGLTPLEQACVRGKENFIKLFLEYSTETNGLLVIRLLCVFGHVASVKTLIPLLEGMAVKEELVKSGLIFAVLCGQHKVVAELLKSGFYVDAILEAKEEEITLLKIAIDKLDLKMFKLLLKFGANADKRLMSQGKEYSYIELINAIDNEEIRAKFLSELNQYRKVRSSETVGYAASPVGQTIPALSRRAYLTQLGMSAEEIEEFEEDRRINQLELKTQSKTQFFKLTVEQSREHTWLDGLIHSSDDRLIPLDLPEGEMAFCFIDKELLESQGCDRDTLEDVWGRRLSVKRFKKLESDKGIYTDQIQFPSGENEVTYTHELKLNKVDRILLFPLPSDTPGACLYVGSRYAPGGLHEKSQVRSIIQSGASGKVIHINWQAERVAKAANEMTPG